MNVPEILERKRDGGELSTAQIEALLAGLLDGSIPDYQISAWLMAVQFRGMSRRETADLTRLMMRSGEVLTWPDLPGLPVDKHSTGGVGDKISIPLAPAAAACGAFVPMISGRGLGHTGGTLDKLESIPGLRTALDVPELRRLVKAHGFAIAGASARLAPADARLYALRDVTGTVPSIPLITASILSKKLAAGIEFLVLDVKSGSGAFLRDPMEARTLARTLVDVCAATGKRAVAFLTSMDQPLGQAVGNALEIRESMDVLEGGGPADVVELVVALGGAMLEGAGIERDPGAARRKIADVLTSGAARERFLAWVAAQGGDARRLERGEGLASAPVVREIEAPRNGVIAAIDAREVGFAANALGAGRAKVGDAVDPSVGFRFRARLGDRVSLGDPLVQVHAPSQEGANEATRRVLAAFRFEDDGTTPAPLVLDVVRQA